MLLWTALIVDTVARDLSRILFTQEEYGCTIFIPPSVDDTARGPSADAEVVVAADDQSLEAAAAAASCLFEVSLPDTVLMISMIGASAIAIALGFSTRRLNFVPGDKTSGSL